MSESARKSNFLSEIIEGDLAARRTGGRVVTRFPPEPNGFLHIGHAKSIVLNFGLAQHYRGRAHLRFDDTNPTTEDPLYVKSIQEDVRWLGYDWGQHLYYASDYFERMYQCAERLIGEGKAYVDSQTIEEIRDRRGSFEKPGTNSPYRNRDAAESLEIFKRMRAGELADGAAVLRAKIDMGHPNLLMRDPLLYRIRHAAHHRTEDRWCIYPMYDYAHPLEDAFEGVTHSLCTLEFESNRELYDWVLDNLGPWDPRPHQYEFARLALDYTVLSKRKLLQLVNEKRVAGWDDPRMPTIAGLRRRGVTPEAIRNFAELIGVAKNNSVVDIGKLEFAIRGDLENRSPRAMAVLDPLPVTITNWPSGVTEQLSLPWWPDEPARAGSRAVPFSGKLFIEREDFSERPPKGWKRLSPGVRARLLGAFVVRCDEVVRAADGTVSELRCSYEPDSKGGKSTSQIRGTLHWVDAAGSIPAEVRLYDRLFKVAQPDAEGDFIGDLNPQSLIVASSARLEPALSSAKPEDRYQFMRQGYFALDPIESLPGALVFNRVIGLKSTWAAKADLKEERRRAKATRDGAPAASKKRKTPSRVSALDPKLAKRRDRYIKELGLSPEQADLLTRSPGMSSFFEAAVAEHHNAEAAAKWLLNDLIGLAKGRDLDALPFSGADFGRFVALVDEGKITQVAGRTLLAHLVERGGDPRSLVGELRLQTLQDDAALSAAIDRVIQSHPAEVSRFRAGEKKLFGVLIGAAMRETQGTADPGSIRKILADRLG